MADPTNVSGEDTAPAAVLGWVVPRPTGRWHQAIVVTATDLWVTPEISYADNEAMEAAAAAGTDAFHMFLKGAGWIKRPDRVALSDLRGINWNETTGWMRVGGADDVVVGAMIPDRKAGDRVKVALKQAIASRIGTKKD